MEQDETQKTSPFEPLLPALLACLQDPDGFDLLTWYDLWGAGYRPTAAAEAMLHLLAYHPSADLRKDVAELLGRLGHTVRGAIPALCQALQDKVAAVRQEAARALGELAAQEAAPALQTALKDRHPAVRQAAAEALLSIDPAAILAATTPPATTRRLLQHLHSGDFITQYRAIVALADPFYASHEVVRALRGKLGDTNWYIQTATENTLKAMGEAALPFLHELLTAPDLVTRKQATAGLRCLGPAAAPAAETLVRDPSERIRKEVVETLWEQTDLGPEGEAALLQALHDPVAAIRDLALRALARRALAPPIVVPWLIERLDAPDAKDRDDALWALEQYGEAARAAVPALTALLHDTETAWRAHSVLRHIGPAAAAAVPALISLLESADPVVRRDATETLEQLGQAAQAAVPALLAAIDDTRTAPRPRDAEPYETDADESAQEEQNVLQARVAAIAVFAKIAPDIQVAAVFECLRDPAVAIRWAACRALWQRGVRTSEVQAVLLRTLPVWLQQDIQDARWTAYETLEAVLQELELHGPEWHDALLEWQQDPDPEVRWAARCALWQREVRTSEIKAEVLSAVSRKVYTTLEIAVWTLATLDPADPDFIRIFVDYLTHSDRKVRESAGFGLDRAVQAEAQYWLAHVCDPDAQLRCKAVIALGQLWPSEDILQAVLGACQDADPAVRTAAVQALGHLGLTAPQKQEWLVATLANALTDDRAAIRLAAAEGLANLGAAAKRAVPDLLQTLQDPSNEVRGVVATVLYHLDPHTAVAAGVQPPQPQQPWDTEEDAWLDELTERLSCPRHRKRRGRGKRRK
jgi:HEAT repeat protein